CCYIEYLKITSGVLALVEHWVHEASVTSIQGTALAGSLHVYVFIAFIPVFLVCSVVEKFPTDPVTSEAHPYPHSCLTFSRGAATGPFVRGCETER
ncbi:hypothetical protein Taro_026660, partial [Colocasia esculenta]|nr:hypothetical protein [Colocasia esculenta]